ncbi:lipoyl domain-containing protein [Mesorhizobium sp. PAMC28654]|uniref:lipoyl domain-containing protein n=1 Tax=Mesorhizobium sp. PAMC28654 TaxID=2880934 RepID=UPI001D0B0D60|nr:lipoyl domain-containing protein [Mesorhizobium sp. PAMC28654]UDL90654.1 lipoyl domain-containing protein [Mesorhizobium sp. PAMC28654]
MPCSTSRSTKRYGRPACCPRDILERWFIASGDTIKAGDRIAEVRVEDALHEIVAAASGRATIVATANAVIEPGSILATLEPQSA